MTDDQANAIIEAAHDALVAQRNHLLKPSDKNLAADYNAWVAFCELVERTVDERVTS